MSIKPEETVEAPWRIEYIRVTKEKPKVEGNLLALLGAVIFVCSIFVFPAILVKLPVPEIFKDSALLIIAPALIGLFICFYAILKTARKKRKDWVMLKAVCADMQIKQVHTMNSNGRGATWTFRLLCDFEFDGQKYRATPYFFSTFATRRGILKFLTQRITKEGIVEIYINPKNPLECEIAKHWFLQIFLYS